MAEATGGSLRNCVFFVGAGISSAWPSRLPHAAGFAGEIFDLLCETGRVYLGTRARRHLKAGIKSLLRLEIFLETLAQEIPPATVFAPFAKFTPAQPNAAHFAIALLSGPTIVTTNQDLLLEAACARLGINKRILHLHGTCDRVASIITIISQYLGGLEPGTRRAFQAAISGMTVVVAGYSGRDLDIMPLLVENAGTVRWILHRGPPSSELAHAREVMGDRLQIMPVHTDRWLRLQMSRHQRGLVRQLMAGARPAATPIPQQVSRAFGAISETARNWAIARVLEQLGRHRRALTIYRRLAASSVVESRLLADLARATARVRGHRDALAIFASLLERPDLPADVRAAALLGHLDALRNTSRPVEALHDLNTLDQFLKVRRDDFKRSASDKRYWHFRGWSLSARAGIERIEGRARTAARRYARAEQAFGRARDVDGRIDIRTWKAESLLILGDYPAALAAADAAIADAIAYAKDLVRGWPWYVRAEILALSGRCHDALADAAHAEKVLTASGNIQGPMWCLLLKSDCYREIEPARVLRVLAALRGRLRAHPLAHVRARLYLEEAEVARGARDWPGLAGALAELRSHLADKAAFARPPRLLFAHARLVEAEAARQRGDADAPALLRRARAAYHRIGAASFVARINVALSLIGAGDVPAEPLLAHCRALNYAFEVERLKATVTGFYPIHFV